MATEWPDNVSIELINRVREHENLWDPHHPHKKRNAIKIDSWKKISKEVGRSSEDSQKKWQNLCQSYRKYRRGRKGKSGQGANEGSRITWFAYDTIHSFMNDVYKPHGNTDVVSNLYSLFNYH